MMPCWNLLLLRVRRLSDLKVMLKVLHLPLPQSICSRQRKKSEKNWKRFGVFRKTSAREPSGVYI